MASRQRPKLHSSFPDRFNQRLAAVRTENFLAGFEKNARSRIHGNSVAKPRLSNNARNGYFSTLTENIVCGYSGVRYKGRWKSG
jgi:hypothetical protein